MTGELINDGKEMRFVFDSVGRDGSPRLNRWSLIDLPDGRVRELALASADGGQTWETSYDLYWSASGR